MTYFLVNGKKPTFNKNTINHNNKEPTDTLYPKLAKKTSLPRLSTTVCLFSSIWSRETCFCFFLVVTVFLSNWQVQGEVRRKLERGQNHFRLHKHSFFFSLFDLSYLPFLLFIWSFPIYLFFSLFVLSYLPFLLFICSFLFTFSSLYLFFPIYLFFFFSFHLFFPHYLFFSLFVIYYLPFPTLSIFFLFHFLSLKLIKLKQPLFSFRNL
jgi:hypothetical protein